MSLMNYKYLSNWLLIKIIVSYSAKKKKLRTIISIITKIKVVKLFCMVGDFCKFFYLHLRGLIMNQFLYI